MNQFIKILTPIAIFISFSIASAQDYSSHEIGFIFGSASFTTDYGQRNNFMSNVGGNVGPGIGIIYYWNFHDYRYKWMQRGGYFSEHFRIRAELSYMEAELNHFGKWIEVIGGVTGEKLRAMHGKTYLVNLGAQMEFHWVDIVDFGTRRIPEVKWSPYISAGVMVDYYDPTVLSDYGDGDWKNNPNILFPKWAVPGAASDKKNITLSATLGIGTRHKLGEYSDILIESRWQYFFNNYVDGLYARQDEAEKFNDWLLFIHIGYVYYLN